MEHFAVFFNVVRRDKRIDILKKLLLYECPIFYRDMSVIPIDIMLNKLYS